MYSNFYYVMFSEIINGIYPLRKTFRDRQGSEYASGMSNAEAYF